MSSFAEAVERPSSRPTPALAVCPRAAFHGSRASVAVRNHSDFVFPVQLPSAGTIFSAFASAVNPPPPPSPQVSAASTLRPRSAVHGVRGSVAARYHPDEVSAMYLSATNPVPKSRGRRFAPVPPLPAKIDFIGFRHPPGTDESCVRQYLQFCDAYGLAHDDDDSIARWATALSHRVESDTIKRYVSGVNTHLQVTFGKPPFLLPPRTFFKSFVEVDTPMDVARDREEESNISDQLFKNMLLHRDPRTQLLAWLTVCLAARAADVTAICPERLTIAFLGQKAFPAIDIPGLGRLVWCTANLQGLTKNTVASAAYRATLRSDHLIPFPLPQHLVQFASVQPRSAPLFPNVHTRHFPSLFGRNAKDFKKSIVTQCAVDSVDLRAAETLVSRDQLRLLARHVGPQTTNAYTAPRACEVAYIQLGLPDFWARFLRRVLVD